MALILKPIKDVVKASLAGAARQAERAAAVREKAVNANLRLAEVTAKILNLPSARPQYQGQSVAVATVMSNESLPRPTGIYYSERRTQTEAGLRDLESWAALDQDVIHAEGSRIRQQLSRLAARLREQFGPGHAASRFYGELSQTDSQSMFVLARTGFLERLHAVVGDEERGILDTKNLISMFEGDADGGPQWQAILEELRNSRQYRRRNLGTL